MKKILHITPVLDIGGAEKVVRDIALYANSEEYETHLLILKDKVGIYEQQLLEKGCRCFHVQEPSDSYINYFVSLMKAMKRENYSAVHAHTMFNCGWIMLAAALCGVPIRIAHSHSALNNGSRYLKAIYEKIMQFMILSCATDLVACGIAAGYRLFGEKNFTGRGTLVLNGINVRDYSYSAQCRKLVRDGLNLNDRFVVGHVGHLMDVKNQAFLLDLMPQVLEERSDALLLLLGEGEDRPMLEQKIREMGLQNHVIMTGNVTNVADYLSAMDVFVFPSLYEGLPLSILEVQANGLPCVISDRVPDDVFLTDLIHPLSLNAPKEQWVDAIVNARRGDNAYYNRMLQNSEYTVEKAMEKIYRIYDKE